MCEDVQMFTFLFSIDLDHCLNLIVIFLYSMRDLIEPSP